jgi:hypothetical protein
MPDEGCEVLIKGGVGVKCGLGVGLDLCFACQVSEKIMFGRSFRNIECCMKNKPG